MLVTPIENYIMPPIEFTEVLELLNSGLNAQTFSYGQNNANPLLNGFVAQSCIVDGRNMQAGDECAITFSNKFFINLRAGIYRSYIIPAYTNTQFTINYSGSTVGYAFIRLYNYQMLPCDYSKTYKGV